MTPFLDEKLIGFKFASDESNNDIEIYKKKINNEVYCELTVTLNKRSLELRFEMRKYYKKSNYKTAYNFPPSDNSLPKEEFVILKFREYLKMVDVDMVDEFKEKLEQARASYLEKYPYSPNIIFIGQDLIEDLSLMIGGYNFYEKTHTHLWGCDVIRVLSEGTLKFAEHSDVRKAVVKFNLDNSCNFYSVPKSRTTLGGRSNVNLIPSKVIELEPIEFTKEEVEIYSMQN